MRGKIKVVAVLLLVIYSLCIISHSTATEVMEGDPFSGNEGLWSDMPDFDIRVEDAKGRATEGSEFQTQLHGYLETRNRLRLTDGEWLSTRQRLRLELDSFWGSRAQGRARVPFRFYMSGAVDADPAAADLSHDNDRVRIYVDEAFATFDRPGWNLVLGQKIHRTGTGDGINPMDLVNPLNHRDPIANGRSDSRLAIPLALGSVQLPLYGGVQEARLEAVFIPLARVNQLNSPGSPWESPGLAALRQSAASGELVLEDQDEPNRYFEQSELGLSLSATFAGWDVGLSGFIGYNDTPVFSAFTLNTQKGNELHFRPVHPRFSAIGLTFAKGFERSTLRGELAFKPDLPLTAHTLGITRGFFRRRVVEGVVGIDHTFGVSLYTNLQYFFTVTDDAGPTVNETFAQGITYEVHDKFFNDALKSGVRGICSFSEEGLSFEFFNEYQPLDSWLVSLSLLLFEGPSDGAYGGFDRNDALTLKIRYSF